MVQPYWGTTEEGGGDDDSEYSNFWGGEGGAPLVYIYKNRAF